MCGIRRTSSAYLPPSDSTISHNNNNKPNQTQMADFWLESFASSATRENTWCDLRMFGWFWSHRVCSVATPSPWPWWRGYLPCSKGEKVPASRFRYGSILIDVTSIPQQLSRVPNELAITPLPTPLITPPVTRMYFMLSWFGSAGVEMADGKWGIWWWD